MEDGDLPQKLQMLHEPSYSLGRLPRPMPAAASVLGWWKKGLRRRARREDHSPGGGDESSYSLLSLLVPFQLAHRPILPSNARSNIALGLP